MNISGLDIGDLYVFLNVTRYLNFKIQNT